MRPWYRLCLNIADGFMRLFMRPEISARELVPDAGGLIVAVNHLSYWDPPLTAVALQREAHFMAKEELFKVPLFSNLIRSLNAYPVRRGVPDKRGIARAVEVLKGGQCLLLFPEGTRSKTGNIGGARPGLGLIWTLARVPVLPAYLVGTNRWREWITGRTKVRFRFGPVLTEQDLLDGEPLDQSREQQQRISDRVLAAITRIQREWDAAKASAAPGSAHGGANT